LLDTDARAVDPDWRTVKEYADLIRVHPMTVYAWIADGRLEGMERYGRSIRIDPARAVVKPTHAD
jgi:excisionase family DNA binding protein